MADYTPLLTRAIEGQDEAARQAIYARAREALERQLRGFEPKLDEGQITQELAGLDAAIAGVEAEARTAEAESLPAEAEPALPVEEADQTPAEASVEAEAEPLAEDEVLQPASTDEVESPALLEPVIPPSARPRVPLREEKDSRRKPLALALGAAFVLILAMGGLALTRRGAPDPLGQRGNATPEVAAVEAGKTEGRLGTEQPASSTPTAPRSAPPSDSAPANGTPPAAEEPQTPLSTSTRAFMVLERAGNPPVQVEGRALWSYEPDPASPGRKALRTIVAFPAAEMTIDFTVSPNADAKLGASHLIMAIFDMPKTAEPVRELSPIEWRERETTQGSVLRGAVVPVQDNVFMLTLDKAAQSANLDLIKSQKWIVFEFRLANGQRGAALVEKGSSGEKAVNEALAAWK